jgi:hypothetical protein
MHLKTLNELNTVKNWRRSATVASICERSRWPKQRPPVVAGTEYDRSIRRRPIRGPSHPIRQIRRREKLLPFPACIWSSFSLQCVCCTARHCTVKMKLIDSGHALAFSISLSLTHTHTHIVCLRLLLVLLACFQFFQMTIIHCCQIS